MGKAFQATVSGMWKEAADSQGCGRRYIEIHLLIDSLIHWFIHSINSEHCLNVMHCASAEDLD